MEAVHGVCLWQLGTHMMYSINCLWTAEETIFAITGDLGKKNEYVELMCELLSSNHIFVCFSLF